MSDQPSTARAARPPLRSTVRRVATAATAAAVLVWSGLFYSAVSNYNAATHTTAAAPSGSNGKATQAVPASAPLVTHTS